MLSCKLCVFDDLACAKLSSLSYLNVVMRVQYTPAHT